MTSRSVPTQVLAFVPSLPAAPCWVTGRSWSDRVGISQSCRGKLLPKGLVASAVSLFDRRGRFFVRPEGPFLRPDLGSGRRRAQLRSRLAAGHRRRRRAAVLTAASTAPGSDGSGPSSGDAAGLAVGFAGDQHGPGDARGLGGLCEHGDLDRPAGEDAALPGGGATGTDAGGAHYGAGAEGQELAQPDVALAADAGVAAFAGAGVFARGQAAPWRQSRARCGTAGRRRQR